LLGGIPHDVRLGEVLVIGGTVAVNLVQNPLHRRGRHGVDYVDECAGLPRPDFLDDALGDAVEFLEPVVEQRVDRDLAEQVRRRIVAVSQPGALPVTHGERVVIFVISRAKPIKLA